MKTVHVTLDEDLLARVDRAVKRLKTTRSGFTRKALHEALRQLSTSEREAKHRRGYERKPGKAGEFGPWPDEHVWLE